MAKKYILTVQKVHFSFFRLFLLAYGTNRNTAGAGFYVTVLGNNPDE